MDGNGRAPAQPLQRLDAQRAAVEKAAKHCQAVSEIRSPVRPRLLVPPPLVGCYSYTVSHMMLSVVARLLLVPLAPRRVGQTFHQWQSNSFWLEVGAIK